MSLYSISIPQMTRILGQVPGWLDKAKACGEQKKFDPEVLLSARLAPDQWALARHIQVITLAPQRLSALLRGLEPPPFEAGEATFEALRAGIDASIKQMNEQKPEDFDGDEDRLIPLPFMKGKGMKASDFVTQFTLPNFYFHATTAYAILRHNGVDVGKMDYLGELSIRDL